MIRKSLIIAFASVFLSVVLIAAFSLFFTFAAMTVDVYVDAVQPLQKRHIDLETALSTAKKSIHVYMAGQIEWHDNQDTVISLLSYVPGCKAPELLTWGDVPWVVLLPVFVWSELKTAIIAIDFDVHFCLFFLTLCTSVFVCGRSLMKEKHNINGEHNHKQSETVDPCLSGGRA